MPVAVTGELSTTAPGDTYPTHNSLLQVGGWREVADITERNAIAAARRRSGMRVRVVSTGREYVLGGDLTTWNEQPGAAAYTREGQILSETFASLGGHWTSLGASWSTSSGNLVPPGASAFFTEYVQWNARTTCLEDWVMEGVVVVPSPMPTAVSMPTGAAAIVLGLKSTETRSSDRMDLVGVFGVDQTYAGQCKLYQVFGGTFTALTPTVPGDPGPYMTIAAGDRVKLRLHRYRNGVTMTAENLTQTGVAPYSIEFRFANNNTTLFAHNTGRFVVGTSGGAWLLENLNIFSNADANPGIACVGDSITYGLAGGVTGLGSAVRYADVLRQLTGERVSVYAGSYDQTADLLQRAAEVTARNPRVVVLFAGTNDVGFGTALATTQANLTSLKSTLATNGARVLVVTPLPRTGVALKPLRDWILAQWPTDAVDTFPHFAALGNVTASLISDGTHPTAEGHNLIARLIMEKL